LCWATLGAAEFRFNEAKLLGHAVGMDVSALEQAGPITVTADKVKILPAKERRRSTPLSEHDASQLLFGWTAGSGKRVKKADALKIHPRDPAFRTHLDRADALALVYADAGGGAAGIGAAKSFAVRQGIKTGDATVHLIQALLAACPPALRNAKNKIAQEFAEFRAWHELLEPLFGITPPDWTEKLPDQRELELLLQSSVDEEDDLKADEEGDDEAEAEDDEDAE
jgi:putative DNA methylase